MEINKIVQVPDCVIDRINGKLPQRTTQNKTGKSQSAKQTEIISKKGADAVRNMAEAEIHTPKVFMSPVFSTKEQEELFARCAKESMSTTAQLEW